MGLIGIEKVRGSNYNNDLEELNHFGENTYVFESDNERRINDNLAVGMNENRLQKEGSLIGTCFITFFLSFFTILLIICVTYILMSNLGDSFQIFPHKSNYTVDEFNGYLRRAFIILFVLVAGLSVISMIIINRNVKNRFKEYYLSKFKIFIYDFFVIIQNIVLYIGEMYIMFQVINVLHRNFVTYQTNGIILGSVNIDAIEIFKYVIVIIMTIFIVLNCFSAVDIIHQKNRFVFENQI